MSQLQTPFQIGSVTLPNRVVLAPLTRMRAFEGRAPGDLQVTYYRQRAGAGLILTEATSVSPMGVGYPNTPGIWSAEQVAGWKRVTDAVHAEGGKIAPQLWHCGGMRRAGTPPEGDVDERLDTRVERLGEIVREALVA